MAAKVADLLKGRDSVASPALDRIVRIAVAKTLCGDNLDARDDPPSSPVNSPFSLHAPAPCQAASLSLVEGRVRGASDDPGWTAPFSFRR